MNLVLGSTGLLGSAIVRELAKRGQPKLAPARRDLDLLDARQVDEWFMRNAGPMDRVYLCAGTVGGIGRNIAEPLRMLHENLRIQQNVFSAFRSDCYIGRLLFCASSCMYPRNLEVMRETDLLTGPCEPTNEPYAIAKIAGVIACRHTPGAVAAVLPNLYGPGDNFDLETSHVVAGMMRRMHEAKVSGAASVTLWGTGKPVREFLFVDDAARTCVDMMESGATGHHNVCGTEASVRQLSEVMREVVEFYGSIEWDTSKPDGFPRKVMSGTQRPLNDLWDGLELTYRWFCAESMRRFDREPRHTWRRTEDDVTDVAEPAR